MTSPYTTFGAPPDGVGWVALVAAGALACLLHAPVRQRLGLAGTGKWLLPTLAVSAALLSAGYVAYYLRFGPRIIDATSYFLEARAIARGHFAFPVPSPSGSFRGRFLLSNATHELSVIFPPGYPALLALGFLAGAPLAVGPLLAGLIVLCTHALARRISGRDDVAHVAAALSLLCAALRYHTADTMSHGWCALLLSFALLCALRGSRWDALLCGFACGWLIATRPVSGAVAVLLCLNAQARLPRRWAEFAVGLVPGLVLLACYQHAATGSAWASPQLSYYALADGPPGCFRYGFGPQIGCVFEHGDYVRSRLPHGYGLGEAIGVTLRRLAIHCIDIQNAAPLALLCPLGAWFGRCARGVRTLFFGSLLLMLAYAPFYFDASYPGGGARLFAELLPLEHVLLAIALIRLDWTGVALPLSLVGFALHASFSHRALSERDGGRPMFDARVLERAGVEHGLVFVDTDHGFNLGHEPGELDAEHHLVIARLQHDAHDWLLWTRLGRPASFRYERAAPAEEGTAKLISYSPSSAGPLRFEAEAEWPPFSVGAGWAHPDFFPCASGGRGLRLRSSGREADALPGPFVSLELPLADAHPHRVRLGWVRAVGPETALTFTSGDVERSATIGAGNADCVEVDLGLIELSPGASEVRIRASRPGMLDYLEVLP